MRILVISLFHAPFNSIASSRATHYCNALRKKGHDVKVICRHFNHTELNSPDLGVGSKPTTGIETYRREGDIIYTAFHPDNDKLKKGRFMPPGIRGYYYLRQVDAYHYSFVENGYQAFVEEFRNENFDLIIASSPPLAPLILANKLSQDFGIKWIADFRDSPVLDEDQGWIRKIKIKSVNKLLSSADGFQFVSPGMEELSKTYFSSKNASKPYTIIYNGFHLNSDEIDSAIIQQFEDIKNGHDLLLLYTGSIYPQRNLDFFLAALRTVNHSNIAVVLLGIQDTYKNQMQTAFSDLNLFFLPKTTQATSIALQEKASALILTIWKGSYTGFSGKVFEYLYTQNHIILDHKPAKDLEKFLAAYENHYCLHSDHKRLPGILQEIRRPGTSHEKNAHEQLSRSAQIDKMETFIENIALQNQNSLSP